LFSLGVLFRFRIDGGFVFRRLDYIGGGWFGGIRGVFFESGNTFRQTNNAVPGLYTAQPATNGLHGDLKPASQLRIVDPAHGFDEQNFVPFAW